MFRSFSVVGWIDVFTRRTYQEILISSIEFCQRNKRLKIYCYCILPNHTHFISISENGSLTNILRDFKAYTAKQLMKAIAENQQAGKKNWILRLFRYYGSKSSQKQNMQFWKHDNHPFFLYTPKMIQQKLIIFMKNPVEAVLVLNQNNRD